jgi:phage/plasmid-associated DNA primase
MQFERKYKELFSALPAAKLIISGNAWLPFKDRSEGDVATAGAAPFPVNIPQSRAHQESHTGLVAGLERDL